MLYFPLNKNSYTSPDADIVFDAILIYLYLFIFWKFCYSDSVCWLFAVFYLHIFLELIFRTLPHNVDNFGLFSACITIGDRRFSVQRVSLDVLYALANFMFMGLCTLLYIFLLH